MDSTALHPTAIHTVYLQFYMRYVRDAQSDTQRFCKATCSIVMTAVGRVKIRQGHLADALVQSDLQ